MKRNELYDALSGIDRTYIECSEDIAGISAEFRREKARRTGMISSLCCCLVLLAVAAAVGGEGLFAGGYRGGDMLVSEPASSAQSTFAAETSTRADAEKENTFHTTSEPAVTPATTTNIESENKNTTVQTAGGTDSASPSQAACTTSVSCEIPTDDSYKENPTTGVDGFGSESWGEGLVLAECAVLPEHEFTIGEYLGKMCNFAGKFLGSEQFLTDCDAVYTVKEGTLYLAAEKSDGSLLILELRQE